MSAGPGRTARRRTLPANRIPAVAGNPKRRASCLRRAAAGPGQCDLGGGDPRPSGAMALGAPPLVGLAATIAKQHSGARDLPWRSQRSPLPLAMAGLGNYNRARTPWLRFDLG